MEGTEYLTAENSPRSVSREGGLQYLLASVDDVLGEGEAVDAGPA